MAKEISPDSFNISTNDGKFLVGIFTLSVAFGSGWLWTQNQIESCADRTAGFTRPQENFISSMVSEQARINNPKIAVPPGYAESLKTTKVIADKQAQDWSNARDKCTEPFRIPYLPFSLEQALYISAIGSVIGTALKLVSSRRT